MDYNSKDLRDAYYSDGFICLKKIFTTEECNAAIQDILDLEANLNPSNTIRLVTEEIGGRSLVKYYQTIYEHCINIRKFFSFRLLSLCSALLESDKIYYSDIEAHIRNPGGGEIPKHQDNFYFNLNKARGMTCYIALTPQSKESGGLNYIKGSHKRLLQHHGSSVPGFSSFLRDNDCENKGSESAQIISPVYEAGDVTIHHPKNIHFSKPLSADITRAFALSVRVFASDETIDEQGMDRYKLLLKANRKNHD